MFQHVLLPKTAAFKAIIESLHPHAIPKELQGKYKCTTNENNANHLKSIFNMDFKWLALFSFVVHLWPKLNVKYKCNLIPCLLSPVCVAQQASVQNFGNGRVEPKDLLKKAG